MNNIASCEKTVMKFRPNPRKMECWTTSPPIKVRFTASRSLLSLSIALVLSAGSMAQSVRIVADTTKKSARISSGFVGFSFNPSFMSQFFSNSYNGKDSRAVTLRLLEHFMPWQQPSIRIIGANGSWWKGASPYATVPVSWNPSAPEFPGTHMPSTTPSLTAGSVDAATDLTNLARSISQLSYTPQVIFGMNASVIDRGRTVDFARNIHLYLVQGIGATGLRPHPGMDLQYELGNEPDAYVANGRRLSTYNASAMADEFAFLSDAISRAGIGGGFAGPALAKPNYVSPTTSGNFTAGSETFITKVKSAVGSKLATMTYHDYPLGCASDVTSVSSFLEKFWQPDPASSKYAGKYTEAEIHDPSTGIKRSIDEAKRQGLRFRVAELNSICQGGSDGISNSFGAALWSIDFMYELALAGGDGVNFACEGGSTQYYSPFTFNSTQIGSNNVLVNPVYHGALLFAIAAQRNLYAAKCATSLTSGNAHVKAFVTGDSLGKTRIMILNKGISETDTGRTTVHVVLPGRRGDAASMLLQPAAGSIGATPADASIRIGEQAIMVAGANAGGLSGNPSWMPIAANLQGDSTHYTLSSRGSSAMILEAPAASIVTSVSSLNAGEYIRAFPNPASSGFRMEFFLHRTKKLTLRILSMNGQLMQQLADVDNGQWMDIRSLPGGTYILQVTDADGRPMHLQRLIKTD